MCSSRALVVGGNDYSDFITQRMPDVPHHTHQWHLVPHTNGKKTAPLQQLHHLVLHLWVALGAEGRLPNTISSHAQQRCVTPCYGMKTQKILYNFCCNLLINGVGRITFGILWCFTEHQYLCLAQKKCTSIRKTTCNKTCHQKLISGFWPVN